MIKNETRKTSCLSITEVLQSLPCNDIVNEVFISTAFCSSDTAVSMTERDR